MVCGMEIDFRKVFDMILQVAVDGNLRPDKMGKKYGAVLLSGMSLEAFYPAIDDGFCTMIGEGSGADYNINVPRENGFDGGWSINHSMISRSN
ncbi:hypothetical protein Pyn_19399 [Prunus yedoensis var. nudiflora]|uniref:Uncharacterized protein n=1 Tax=Prunus yedoensis var. nudiflora TaxID=2094558 RepID=A0A314UKF5_PRUYE|nr:hypothetical protein Pyn_19399 [Prunus yedoensis var. nudiflora]